MSVQLGSPGSIFSEWDWDGHRLSIQNDRYGMLQLFYTLEPNRVILSTSIEGMLRAGVSPDLDPSALAVILRIGYPVGDDTPFRSIRTVPPGVSVRWEDTGPRLTGGRFLATANGLDRNQALNAYVDLFRGAIERQPPEGRFVVPLSAGRDSRHILFALLEAGHRPDLVVTAQHHPPRQDEDARIASIVAEDLGLEHEILPQPKQRVAAEVRKNSLTNYCTPGRHAWYLPVADYVASRFDCSYDGLAGDMLSMARNLKPAKLKLYRAGQYAEYADGMLKTDETALRNLLTDDVYQAWSRELAIERLTDEMPKHAAAPNPVRSFRFWNEMRRGIGQGPYGVFRPSRVLTPYLDHKLVDMLAGLAPEVVMQKGGHFHTDAIRLGYPQHAHLPIERLKVPRKGGRHYYWTYARQTLAYLSRTGIPPQVRSSFLWPRLVRSVLDPSYVKSVHWLAPRTLYLAQLHAMIERATAAASGG